MCREVERNKHVYSSSTRKYNFIEQQNTSPLHIENDL